ncbi:MAG: DNA-processing protein DprA [Alphaproteobacteria bacterium]
MLALSPRERLDRLRLARSENVGPITFQRLIERFGSAGAALEALPNLARQGGRRGAMRLCPEADALREAETVEQLGARLLVLGDNEYPASLATIADPPPALSVLGDVALLSRPSVAVVGARNASAAGRRFARTLAEEIGRTGFVVVSGLARGIDTAAHEGALASGTIAVVAGGVDVVYPEENRALHGRIARNGAIVAEMPPRTEPIAALFPRRNRTISGLALGTVVVEAALRSGSLITARQALDQGREVFAVPGSPQDPRARGANDLIRQGATLVEGAADILAVLGPAAGMLPGSPSKILNQKDIYLEPPASDMNEYRNKVLTLLSPTPVAVDEIVRQCQLSPATVSLVLLELELAGRLERHPGNQVSIL